MGLDKQRFYSPAAYEMAIKPFHALIVQKGSPHGTPAKRVTVEARNLKEAVALLEAEYGTDLVSSVWLDADWELSRDATSG